MTEQNKRILLTEISQIHHKSLFLIVISQLKKRSVTMRRETMTLLINFLKVLLQKLTNRLSADSETSFRPRTVSHITVTS